MTPYDHLVEAAATLDDEALVGLIDALRALRASREQVPARYNTALKRLIDAAEVSHTQDIQEALDDLVYLHLGDGKRGSAVNNSGATEQVRELRETAGLTVQEIVDYVANATGIELVNDKET